MAWCEQCDREVDEQGEATEIGAVDRCPTCAHELSESPTEVSGDEATPKAPWHFKVLLIGTGLYLIYRLAWFIALLFHHAWNG